MTTSRLYPLTFEPIYKERVWGGERLREALGKQLTGAAPVGESWELVDLSGDQSRVAAGSRAGATLHDLIQMDGEALLGPAALDGERFPLLVKYIDASQTLSVQVHPDREAAERLGGRPKSEAWYILDAEPDAVLYLGLEPGLTAESLRAALAAGEVESLVRRIPVRRGDLFPVPPGTVHAIGAGVLLAEVQQPSDTTYRVYDWGRVGLDGRPRELHVEQALQSIHFDAEPRGPVREGEVDMHLFRIQVLSLGDEAVDLRGPGPAVVVGLGGDAAVEGAGHQVPCGLGGVVLVPHAVRGEVAVVARAGRGRVLLVTFP